MPALQSGQRLSARYIVRERLSEGPLGETWRALDTERDREVVLKVLRPELARSPEAVRCLHAEVEAADRLNHPGIAGGCRLERDGDLLFLVRDFIEGNALSSLRAQAWRSIVPAAIRVGEALGAMHAAGLVHRDLKTGNVILRGDGTVCVIDLASAALAGDPGVLSGGSPYSESPQQLSGDPPTPSDDAYAFGVLLYELLAGYPPFYPNVSRERVLKEPAPQLRPVHPAPIALVDQVMALLAKDAAARPSVSDVVGEMNRLLEKAAQPDAPGPALTQGAPAAIIRPIVRGAGERKADGRPVRRRLTTVLAGTGFLVLLAIVVAVFVELPRFVPKPKVVAPPPAAQAATEPKGPAAPLDLEVLAEQMDKAEQVQGAYASMYQSLKRRGADEWAAVPFEAARKQGEQAERQYAAREFLDAETNYKAALDHLQEASDTAGRVLKEQLDRGARALTEGQSQVARDAFALAQRVDPQNAAAKKGSKRAATLDEVFALLTAASNDERELQWPAAESKYQKALDLDAEATTAREGIARVKARIAGDEFAAAISQGLSNLSAGRLADARARFKRAGEIRPGAREVSDGLDQVAQAERRLQIAAHRQKAEGFERKEQWKDALEEYEAALKVDPALEFAQAGKARATPLAELHRQFNVILNDPERLLSAGVRDQARALIATAEKEPNPGPVLRGAVQKLQTGLQQVEMPVRVALESDNVTEIQIHRVGALGVFEHRELQLSPGHYTVVGTRAGYRDVRRELTILPGQAPPPLVIRCEEPI